MISKSLAFTTLYQNIATKQKADPNDPSVFAEFGRIVRLMITFEPATVASYNLMSSSAESEDAYFF
jgi:hypothetical protein